LQKLVTKTNTNKKDSVKVLYTYSKSSIYCIVPKNPLHAEMVLCVGV